MPASVRAAITDLLDSYRGADGYSTDEYHAESLQHPMAEAKYLLACVEMYRCDLMSETDLAARAVEGVDRLRAHQVDTGSGLGWGLGFAFGDTAPDATYVITTALVTLALHELVGLAPTAAPPECDEMLQAATRYLLDGQLVASERGRLVAYGPSKPDLTFNVTAMWSGVLTRVLGAGHPRSDEVHQVAADLLGRRAAGAGWAYGPSSRRADLLHTCYIYAGLLMALPERSPELDLLLAEDVLRFRGGTDWLDRYDIHEVDGLMSTDIPGLLRPAQISGRHALIGFDAPARSWSMGELLVVVSAASRRAVVGPYWRTQLAALARQTIDECLPEPRGRHAMHLAHGLASALGSMRTQGGST